MLKLVLHRNVPSSIDDLPPKHFKQVFGRVLRLLSDPLPHDSSLLRGHGTLRRIDMGEYRIVYRVDAEQVTVLLIGKRNDDEVYKRLDRMDG